MESISLNINNTEINGKHPIVIIGPNGYGKTTFGANLSRSNNGEWISATRNLQFSDSIRMETPEHAKTQVNNIKNEQKSHPWTMRLRKWVPYT